MKIRDACSKDVLTVVWINKRGIVTLSADSISTN